MKKYNFLRAVATLALTLAFVSSVSLAGAATISSQMGIGSSGAGVSNLQSFLASNPVIYPQGLVTGYFGALTSAAVSNFQVAYDLPSVGRVGPLTQVKMNNVILAGYGIDISAPTISNVGVRSLSSRQVTVGWNTNEAATAKVFYDTHSISMTEASQSFTEPVISASYVSTGTSFLNNQSVVLSNLNPGVQYYYVVESIDASGNVSVSTQGTFTAI